MASVAPESGPNYRVKFPVVLNSLPVLNYSLIFVLVHLGAQAIQTSRDMHFAANPSLHFQIFRSEVQYDSSPPTHPIFLHKEKSTKGRHAFCSSLTLARRLSTAGGEYVQLHLGAGICPKVPQCSTWAALTVQSAQYGVHTKLKGKCQVLFILASVKTNT